MSLTDAEREDLAWAIYQDTGFFGPLTQQQAADRLMQATWAAVCHLTGRAGRFYLPEDDSAEAKIYRLMSKALGDDRE